MGESARVSTGVRRCADRQTGKGRPMLSAGKRREEPWPEQVPVECWAEAR